MVNELAAPPGSVAARALAERSRLTPGEGRIVDVLLAAGPDLIFQSVSDVAAEAGCAISSVVRCCQSLGFKGFQDLKIALSRDGSAPVGRVQDGLDGASGPVDVLARVAAAASEAATTGTSFVDDGEFARAAQLVGSANRVLFLGVGTSAPLAQDAAYRLVMLGITAEAPPDVHLQHVRARLLTGGDVAVCVSHTGSTRETVSAARAAGEAGASVVAVTSFARSPLVDIADVVLVAGSRETAYRVEAMASRVAHLVVLDALFVALAYADESRTNRSLEMTEDVLADHRF